MKKKILFISHEASLTGAPLVLLYFMEWLVENHPNDYDIGILHLKGGELEPRFNKLAKHVFKVEPIKPIFLLKVANKLLPQKLVPKSTKPTDVILSQVNKLGFDIIYANTALTLSIATAIKLSSAVKTKLIAHLHEMHVSLKSFVKNPEEISPHIDKIIAVAEVVKTNILQEWNLENEQVDVVYEFSKTNIDSKSVLAKGNVFTVGASGRAGWRKGNDLFVQVANCIKSTNPSLNINFEWIGRIDANELLIVEEDLKKLNLDNVKFLGLKSNPHPLFQNFDVFLMTSKEDPFPLVCIEVGMMGKPIICFDKATGTQEVIENGGGKIVPYLSVEKMAEAVVNYYYDRELLNNDGIEAKKIFSQFTPEIRCPQIYTIIQQTISI
jgi:glycosyltransferase involved in cell wall biosynthesis